MNKKMKLLSVLGLVTAILFLFSPMVTAQSLSISGKVIDKNSQEPVIGASVLIEGTSNGTITDLDGNFMLSNVPSKGNLVVSYIGYATQTLPINGRTSFSVVLAEDTETLDEVVVIGYGVQKKVNLTGSVSSVKGDALERRPVADATQSLQGMVPGLLVSNSNTGRPGASGTLTLRGQGNLDNNANPYILVDGVEMSLSDVNPNDIESISVLKDAASASIYGARAANGVIVITTNRGQEGKTKVSYNGSIKLSPKPDFDYLNLMSSSELVDMQIEGFDYYHTAYENYSYFIFMSVHAGHSSFSRRVHQYQHGPSRFGTPRRRQRQALPILFGQTPG